MAAPAQPHSRGLLQRSPAPHSRATHAPDPSYDLRRPPIAANVLLLAALAAGAAVAAAAANASSCPALEGTPLDPDVSSWTFTLYVPPAFIPALLDPASAASAGAEGALDAAFDGSAITPNL